jgi:hypothetical protein
MDPVSPTPQQLAFDRVLEYAKTYAAIARHFDLKTGYGVSKWRDEVPSERVIPLCEFVNFRVTPHELRTDLYPHPEDGLPSERRVLGLLSEFAEVLTPDERNGVAAAIVKGPEFAIRAIESFDHPVAIREQLLKAANLGEGRAA